MDDYLLYHSLAYQLALDHYRIMTFIWIALALGMIPFIEQFLPAKSVKDPAAVLTVLFAIMALSTAFIALQRTQEKLKEPRETLEGDFTEGFSSTSTGLQLARINSSLLTLGAKSK